MPMPTTNNGKSSLDTGSDDIQVDTVGPPPQRTRVEKSVDHSSNFVSKDTKSIGETSVKSSRDQPSSSIEQSHMSQSRSAVPLDDEENNFTTVPRENSAPQTYNRESQFEDEHDALDDPPHRISSPAGANGVNYDTATVYAEQERQDKAFVQNFWTVYDEILILSLFTQVGILCRLGAAYWFHYFDSVFHSNSALFTSLPLNCLSCFVMGLLCSGESLMEIIETRFTPPRLQQDLHREAIEQLEDCEESEMIYETHEGSNESNYNDNETRRGWRRRRKRRKDKDTKIRSRGLFRRQRQSQSQNPDIFDELREVQLLAWERRIRSSVCLLLFPVKKEDVDIVDNYFDNNYQENSCQDFVQRGAEEEKEPESVLFRSKHNADNHYATPSDDRHVATGGFDGGFDDLVFEEEIDNCTKAYETEMKVFSSSKSSSSSEPTMGQSSQGEKTLAKTSLESVQDEHVDIHTEQGLTNTHGNVHVSSRQYRQVQGENVVDYGTQNNPDLDQIISSMATDVSNKISFIGRVNLANGWDVGTSPEEKSEDLTLGLRDGLCGALSSFSSWISSMVNLFRTGQIGKGFVGLTIGIQLPIVAYRFGQYVSVYIFAWRCRREKRRDERRGYGLQVHTSDEPISTGSPMDSNEALSISSPRTKGRRTVHDEESEVPSIRAIFTALFIICLVAQLTSLSFFKKPEDRLLALSLLFSPLGVLARWRMMKFNSWRPGFPLGTFACNVTACALSGTLGSLLAGKPGPRERIALVSIIAGVSLYHIEPLRT